MWPGIREGFLEEEGCELCVEGETHWSGVGAHSVGGAASWERPASLC